jgi:hypothetical protein
MDFSQVVREVKDLFENVLNKAAMDIWQTVVFQFVCKEGSKSFLIPQKY